MASSPTRRFYRRAFRRMRLYLPLFMLLLLAMVLFLPISGGWLARMVERRIFEATGLPVEISRLEVTLASGYVEALGVRLVGGEDTLPFEVGRVELTGRLSGLLAGGERWPETILVDGLPTLRLERNERGVHEARGPFETLEKALRRALERPETAMLDPSLSVDGAPAAPGGLLGRTPEVRVRNLPVRIDSPAPGILPISLIVDDIHINERPTRTAPMRVELAAMVRHESVEQLRLMATWFPDEDRLAASGTLSGAAVPLVLPPLGDFRLATRDLQLQGTLSREEGDVLDGALNIQAAIFELQQDRIGGERWIDDNLDIRVRFRTSPREGWIRVPQLSLFGEEVDVTLAGEVNLGGDYPGSSRLSIRRLPAGAIALGSRELASRLGVSVEADPSTSTLAMDVRASGPFLRPEELDAEGEVRLTGWLVRHPWLAEPVRLLRANISLTDGEIGLRPVEIGFGGMTARMETTMPIPTADGSQSAATASIRAQGDIASVFDLLLREGLIPPEITGLRAPVSLALTLPYVVRRDAEAGILGEPDMEALEATLTWRSGELGLRALPEAIRLGPGDIRYREKTLTLGRLRGVIPDLDISLEGKVTGALSREGFERAAFDLDIIASGEISRLLLLLRRHLALPPLPTDLSGNFQIDVALEGDVSQPEDTDYRVRLMLDQVAGRVDIPHRQVPVKDLAADLVLDRERLAIRRLSLRVADPNAGDTRAEATGEVTAEGIAVDFKGRTQLEYLPLLLPRDLRDIYMTGIMPAEGFARFTPGEPLPPGPDLLRRWLALFQREDFRVHIEEPADLIADYEIVYRQEGPVSIFARDMPVRVSNIRGNASMTPRGIAMRDVRADVGSAADVLVREALIELGSPTRLHFEIEADTIDANEWMDGWGDREWAAMPASFTPRWRQFAEPYQFVEMKARITANRVMFLQFEGSDVTTDFHLEAWSRQPTLLVLDNLRADLYGGEGEGRFEFRFPRGGRPILTCTADFRDADINAFLDTLLERDQALDGNITGWLDFNGQLLNYPTYTGHGEFRIEQSSVIGNIILVYARDVLRTLSRTGGYDSSIEGRVSMAGEEVHFSDLIIMHPNVRLATEGHVNFRGELFFDVVANIVGRQLSGIPIIDLVGQAIDAIGGELVIYRVRGKIGSPEYVPIPAMVPRLRRMADIVQQRSPSDAPPPAPRRTTPDP